MQEIAATPLIYEHVPIPPRGLDWLRHATDARAQPIDSNPTSTTHDYTLRIISN